MPYGAHGLSKTFNNIGNFFNSAFSNLHNSVDAVSGSSFPYHQDEKGDWIENADARPGSGLLGAITGAFGSPLAPVASSSASGRASSTPQQVVYTDAPYAEMYGMSAQTAYEEALLNTAHQREVADLKAAGLNPVLGISGSGSGSGATPVLQGSGSVNSGKSGKDNRFSDILPYVGAIAGTLIGAKYGHASSGLSSGKAAGEALKVLLE